MCVWVLCVCVLCVCVLCVCQGIENALDLRQAMAHDIVEHT